MYRLRGILGGFMFSFTPLLFAAGDLVILPLPDDAFDNAEPDRERGPAPGPASKDLRVFGTGIREAVGEVGLRVPELGGVGYIEIFCPCSMFGGFNVDPC